MGYLGDFFNPIQDDLRKILDYWTMKMRNIKIDFLGAIIRSIIKTGDEWRFLRTFGKMILILWFLL